MSIFAKAENKMAFLKCGIHGFPGSGKSFTASDIACGLHDYIKSDKPVYFIDTETGSDFLIDKFKKRNVPLLTAKTRAFMDLCTAVDEAEKNGSCLIIDSITHFWNELWETYKKKKNLVRLNLNHWGEIKAEWRGFSERFVNSKLHILMLGRAGFEWDNKEDSEGYSELTKVGTKMKVEGDMAYEPSLMLEMRRGDRKSNGGWDHICTVLKDRFDVINGKEFKDPTFECLLPHIKLLNLGGEHLGIDTTRTSAPLINSDKSLAEWIRKKEIVLEEIQNTITYYLPGQDAQSKKDKLGVLQDAFKTMSWVQIQNEKLEKLEVGLDYIKMFFKDKQEKMNVGDSSEVETKKKGAK